MKQIAKQIIQKEAERRSTVPYLQTSFILSYQWLIDALPESEWVSVEEQGNPEKSGFWWVQVEETSNEIGGLCEAYFTGKEWWDMDDRTVKVLQYHPLPSPPKQTT